MKVTVMAGPGEITRGTVGCACLRVRACACLHMSISYVSVCVWCAQSSHTHDPLLPLFPPSDPRASRPSIGISPPPSPSQRRIDPGRNGGGGGRSDPPLSIGLSSAPSLSLAAPSPLGRRPQVPWGPGLGSGSPLPPSIGLSSSSSLSLAAPSPLGRRDQVISVKCS